MPLKAVIVNLSTLQKYKRWDVGFYTGMMDNKESGQKRTDKDPQEYVDKAQKDLEDAQRRLAQALKDKTETESRLAQMIGSGEVIPVE